MEDSLYQNVLAYVAHGELPDDYPSTKSNFLSLCAHYTVNEKGYLCREGKVVVKESDLPRLWSEYHSHTGMNATWKRIRPKYYFNGGQKWVREMTRECVACAHKNDTVWPCERAPLIPIPVKPKAFWRVHVDLLGPLTPISAMGNRYVGVAVDAITKYPEALGNSLRSQNHFTRFSEKEKTFDRQSSKLLYTFFSPAA